MPANHYIDNKAKLLVTTWEGEAGDKEFIEAIKKYQKDLQNEPDYIKYNEIVDLSKITKFKFTTEGIKSIGQIASTTDQNEAYRKLALIVDSNLAYGLARMYVAYRSLYNKANKKVNVFKNEKEAYKWLEK